MHRVCVYRYMYAYTYTHKSPDPKVPHFEVNIRTYPESKVGAPYISLVSTCVSNRIRLRDWNVQVRFHMYIHTYLYILTYMHVHCVVCEHNSCRLSVCVFDLSLLSSMHKHNSTTLLLVCYCTVYSRPY